MSPQERDAILQLLDSAKKLPYPYRGRYERALNDMQARLGGLTQPPNKGRKETVTG